MLVGLLGMQRIYPCELTVEQYVSSEGHRQVVAECQCPNCRASGTLRRLGTYSRWVTGDLGRLVLILVARFLCLVCGRTVSYLPSFALSYRPVRAATFEAYLDGDRRSLGVQRWEHLLRGYERQMRAFGPQVLRVVGFGFGRAPPQAGSLWPWLKEACGSVTSATRRLVEHFKITVFRSYQCHQPAGAQ